MSRSQAQAPATQPTDAGEKPKTKKAYQKPSFQHERVFETMALSCGKIHPNQGQCRFNRKTS
jgi:hypothetical protein